MILCDPRGEPVVFTVEVVRDPYFPDDRQLVSGNLRVLGEPKEEKKWSGDRHWQDYSQDPIGVVFVPLDDQEVTRP